MNCYPCYNKKKGKKDCYMPQWQQCQPCPVPVPCPSPCPIPCPSPFGQGATGATGVGIESNAALSIAVGTGQAVPLTTAAGATSVGSFAGTRGHASFSVALGAYAGVGGLQNTNTVIVNASGSPVPAGAVNSITLTTVPTISAVSARGGFFVSSLMDVAGAPNVRYSPATGSLNYDGTL